MDAQLVEATIKVYLTEIRSRLDKAAGIGTRSRRLRGCGISREGPRSRTRHGATSVRSNNAAECRKPDQPDR
ncbi:MAG TPA: hypothetical protein VNS63_05535, partial [Blastocatellia bacterium]|nr:hypothetical protein [Blastocatellia bacterium]